MTNDWRPIVRRGVIAALLTAVAIFQTQRSHTPDFLHDYTAARAVRAGVSVSQPTGDLAARFGIVHGFPAGSLDGNCTPHPPLATVLTIPLSFLSFEAARVCWCLLSGLAIFLAWNWRGMNPWSCAASAPMWCVALVLGTHEPLLLLLIVGALMQLSSRPTLAGSLLGMAVAVKAYPAVLVVGLFLSREWRALIAAIMTTVILNLVAELAMGLGATFAWLSFTKVNVLGYVDLSQNLSLVRWVRQVIGPWSPTLIAAALFTLFLLPVVSVVRKGRLACMIPIVLLVSPLSWRHYGGLMDATESSFVERALLALAGTVTLAIGSGWIKSAPDALIALPLTLMMLAHWAKSAAAGSIADAESRH